MADFVPGIWILVILLISPVTMGQGTAKNAIYNGCGTMKQCLGRPEAGNGCVKDGKCEQMLTYAVNKAEKNVEFELYSKDVTTRYVAVGFSKDLKMGEDAVVACLSGTSKVLLKLGINPSGKTPYIESPPDDKILKEISTSSFTNGLKCVFSLPLNFTTQRLVTDLNKGVHIFIVGGPTKGDAIDTHTGSKFKSALIVIVEGPANKNKPNNCNKTTPNLLHLIGTMFLTFIFISPALETSRFVSLI